jgi:hypothetical protein
MLTADVSVGFDFDVDFPLFLWFLGRVPEGREARRDRPRASLPGVCALCSFGPLRVRQDVENRTARRRSCHQ